MIQFPARPLVAFCTLFVLFCNLQGVEAAPSGKRLIQTSPGVTRWMSEAEVEALSHESHEQGRCGSFMDVTDFRDRRPASQAMRVFAQAYPLPSNPKQVEPLFPELSTKSLRETIETLEAYPDRGYRTDAGLSAALWIKGEFERLAAGREDITVELFRHSFKQPSVIARIRGSGASAAGTLADETVIIGAHEDSISRSASRRAPGADDDASGVATVLETFRVLAQSGFRPERTIEFITYAGEEGGLLGSQAIAEQYRKQGRKIAGVLQLDMTMYPGQKREIILVSDRVSPELTRFVAALIDRYVQIPWKQESCGYGCSDHASWNASGYPSATPFEATMDEMNPHIHTDRDRVTNLDFEFGLHFAKLSVAFAVELGLAAN